MHTILRIAPVVQSTIHAFLLSLTLEFEPRSGWHDPEFILILCVERVKSDLVVSRLKSEVSTKGRDG